ncbi:hypothetical protein [Jiangella rhizosphaerae]|uniref:hypothetical protein n=1 Tax=Jiangella rhizosphaerae TaxID=2293569 RepID=UPI0011C44BD3|nr:hypothetical protein [Jiangella rhizosphaerae]
MPVPAHIRRRCQDLLEPGERIGYLIPVTAVWIGPVMSGIECYVAVTDRRIAVLTGGLLRRSGPAEVNAQYPRTTRLGPVEFAPTPAFRLGSRSYEIDDEYVAAVHAADAELDGLLPEDPFPDA